MATRRSPATPRSRRATCGDKSGMLVSGLASRKAMADFFLRMDHISTRVNGQVGRSTVTASSYLLDQAARSLTEVNFYKEPHQARVPKNGKMDHGIRVPTRMAA